VISARPAKPRARAAAAGGVLWLCSLGCLIGAGPGCATSPPPVSKIVAGRVVLSRAVSPDAYEHVARAELYADDERFEEAIVEYQRALRYDRDAPELHAAIAELELELGRVDRAAKAAETSLELGETVGGLIALAHVRQERHDGAGAVLALRRAADIANFAEAADLATRAHLELADAQLEVLDLPGARQTLQNLADDAPASTVARMRLAAVAWSQGAMGEVERRLRETLAIEPNHIEAILTEAWLHTASGRLDEAYRRFSESLERSEGALDVAAAFARFLLVAGRKDEAAELADDLGANGDDDSLSDRVELFRAAHRNDRALELIHKRRMRGELSPELGGRLDFMAAELLADKSRDEAIALLLRVPRAASTHGAARLRAVDLYRRSGKVAEARRVLAEVTTWSPPDKASEKASDGDAVDATLAFKDELVIAQAQLDEKANDAPGALARLAAAVAQRPRNARFRLARAALLERSGKIREALAEVEAILGHDPGSAEALNFWGFLAADHGIELDRATKRIQAALAFDPGSGAILDSLGWAYFQAGKLAEATLFLGQASRLEPEDPEIGAHMAALLERKGDRPGAVLAVRRALGQAEEPALIRRLDAQLERLGGKHEEPARAPEGIGASGAKPKRAPTP
jgi:tetratricopeptide (TPR) repeat protein